MAKRKPTGQDNRQTMEHNSFRVDETTPQQPLWYRAVCDEIAHDKLDQIANGLGGAGDTVVTIFNVTVATANVELTQALPANTKSFIIRSRNKGRILLSYASGGTSTEFITVPANASYKDDNFYSAQSIFFQSNKPGDVIEIIAYAI